MAPRTNKKQKPSKKPIGLIFWTAFFILIIGLFMLNRDLIRNTLEETQISQRLFKNSPAEQNTPPAILPDLSVEPSFPEIPAAEPEAERLPADNPAAQETALTGGTPPESSGSPETTQPPASLGASEPAALPPQQGPENSPSAQPEPRETRERTLYFIQIDSDGAILRTRVTRKLPLSDSPLLDVLQTLLQGPSMEEQGKNIQNFIPRGTKILSATVRGQTAYINFNEEFQYNTYGVEGYAAQLQQIIWTATEFSNIKDVQILIEGRRIDYLGEGIQIGSPLNRDWF
ncbi:MAG: GerMN domain-containing protein [Treponema sp.]|nr:GerMN domain-containing protein [Treponema sp.]